MRGSLFLVGGRKNWIDSGALPSDLYKYEVTANAWSIVPVQGHALPVNGNPFCMAHVSGYLWLYGQATRYTAGGTETAAELWVWNPREGSWRAVGWQARGASPAARADHGCAAAHDRLYVFSGKSFASSTSTLPSLNADLWVLDAVEGSLRPEAELVWTELSGDSGDALLGAAPTGRDKPAMATLGGRMYIFGGADSWGNFLHRFFTSLGCMRYLLRNPLIQTIQGGSAPTQTRLHQCTD